MEKEGLSKWADRAQPVALALLRIVAGFLLWQHGVQKLFGWFSGRPAPAFGLFWSAGMMESILGVLLTVGVLTRPVAMILCGEMAVAFFTQHFPRGFWPIQNQGLPAVQFCFVLLLLWTAGPGRFSLDGLLASNSSAKPGSFTQQSSRLYPVALTLLRLVTAFLVGQYGVRKMFGWLGGHKGGILSRQWFAGMLEISSSPLVVLGVFTRLLASLVSAEMAIAFLASHFFTGHGYWPVLNGGEPDVLFCFSYLFLCTAGPGWLSIDSLAGRHSKTKSTD